VPPLRQFLLRLTPRATLAAAAALAPLVLPSQAAHSPRLQLITTVVNIAVPVGAFEPTTGQAEVTVPRGLVLQVDSPSSWKLRLRATRATLTTQTIPSDSKPIAALQLRNAAGGSLLVVSTTYFEIARGGNTNGAAEYAFDVSFQASTADAAGLYSVNLELDFY
jgi:hypothetical protein